MKKVYTKPQLMFESFSLSTSIAGGCDAIVDTYRGGTCGLNMGFVVVFADVPGTTCTQKIAMTESWNGICYHNPTDDNNLFNS